MRLNKYDKAKIYLAFYMSKYDWVKKEVEKNNIELNINVDGVNLEGRLMNECSKLEIEDCIRCIKEEKWKKHINELYDVLKMTKKIEKKTEIALKIIEAKEKKRLECGNSN